MPPAKRAGAEGAGGPLKRPAGSGRACHSLDDPQKNILIGIQKEQMEKLETQVPDAKAKMKQNIGKVRKAFGRVPLASLCSGSNVAFLAFMTLALTLNAAAGVDNLFDVERDADKRRWLEGVVNKSFGERCVFEEMSDMGDTHARCAAHRGRRCEIPNGLNGPWLVSCGFSCKDISKANSNRKDYQHGVRSKDGNTAMSLLGFVEYCKFHRPPIFICENVTEFVDKLSSNWAEFVKLFFAIGYAVKFLVLDASAWVPQRRRRVYILGMRWAFFELDYTKASDILEMMLGTAASMAFDKPISWSSILVHKKHPQIAKELKELQDIAAKRVAQVVDRTWPDKQLNEMFKAGVSYSSIRNRKVEANPWYKVLVPREQIALLFFRAAKPTAKTFDISQTVSRLPTSSPVSTSSGSVSSASGSSSGSATASSSSSGGDNANADDECICSTLLTGSSIWQKVESREDEERLLLAWEACALQCIPCDALPNARVISRRTLGYLAGDAFCGATISAIMMAILVHMPEIPENPVVESDETDSMLASLIWVNPDEED